MYVSAMIIRALSKTFFCAYCLRFLVCICVCVCSPPGGKIHANEFNSYSSLYWAVSHHRKSRISSCCDVSSMKCLTKRVLFCRAWCCADAAVNWAFPNSLRRSKITSLLAYSLSGVPGVRLVLSRTSGCSSGEGLLWRLALEEEDCFYYCS